MINEKFWKGKRVFVTGHEGFLGSNLTKRLITYGAEITGLDIEIKRKQTIFSVSDYRNIESIKGNISKRELVNKIIDKCKPEILFHLAAEAIVGRCNDDPVNAFKSNIEGTWNILDKCRGNRYIKAIVIASSDKAYGSHEKLPYKEDAALIGNHPYDVSKSCADLIAYTYFHTYRLPVGTTRCGNIYGPGDFNYSRIVPDAIRSALNNKMFFIRSDGEFTRDYVFVQDIVNGYLRLAEQMNKMSLKGESFNFSDENPMKVMDFVKMIYEIAGKNPNFKVLNKAKYEIKHQYLCSQKARKMLGWKPEYSLSEGIRQTIEWYKQYYDANS
jgi:CDP-glucose 4,6-dehydratase